MPIYDQKCVNEECGHEWEDFYKMADPVPPCPLCGSPAKKLLSAVHGSVELTGRDLINKVKSDAQKLKQDASKNESLLANLVGENKYNQNQVLRDKLKKEIK